MHNSCISTHTGNQYKITDLYTCTSGCWKEIQGLMLNFFLSQVTYPRYNFWFNCISILIITHTFFNQIKSVLIYKYGLPNAVYIFFTCIISIIKVTKSVNMFTPQLGILQLQCSWAHFLLSLPSQISSPPLWEPFVLHLKQYWIFFNKFI